MELSSVIRSELTRHVRKAGNTCTCGNVVSEDDMGVAEWDLHMATAVEKTLRQGGYLLPPDARTIVEYAMQVAGQCAPWFQTRSRERMLERLRDHCANWPDVPAHMVTRHIHETGWEALSVVIS